MNLCFKDDCKAGREKGSRHEAPTDDMATVGDCFQTKQMVVGILHQHDDHGISVSGTGKTSLETGALLLADLDGLLGLHVPDGDHHGGLS